MIKSIFDPSQDTPFNSHLAQQMYGVATEEALRKKIYGTRSAITPEEIEALKTLLLEFNKPVYVEVGVYFGGTFATILDFLKDNKKEFHAYGLDLFEDLKNETFGSGQTHELVNKWNILNVAYQDDLALTLQEMGHENFILLKGSSDKMVEKIDKKIDVCLIDGNHTYSQVKLDFEAVMKQSHPGSAIVLDNSTNDIEPDPQYVALDGGPWKLCEELKIDPRVSFIRKIHRCSIFKVL